MMTKRNVTIVAILALIIGLVIGYYVGKRQTVYRLPITLTGDEMGVHGVMEGTTEGLSGKIGDELDKAFIDEMIIHHEGAVEMAGTLIAGTKRSELLKLGNDIISAQTGEIEMMKRWRTEWFGN